jgi:predicted amidohydrolase
MARHRFVLTACVLGAALVGAAGVGPLLGLTAPAQEGGVKVAIVQYQVQEMDKVGVDGDRVERFVRAAAGQGARLIVAPELCFYRYAPWEQNGVTAARLAGAYNALTKRFASLAEELGICLVIGLREPLSEERVYNTALFFGPHGEVLGKHRKTVPASGEFAWTEAGTTATAFTTPIGKVGMLICKDAKAGPWARAFNDRSIDLYVLIAGDDNGRSFGSFGRTCREARCLGILANQVTKHGKGAGNSAWGFPDGTVTYLGGGEQVFYATLPLKWSGPTTQPSRPPAAVGKAPYPSSPVITSIEFDFAARKRLAPGSDNWPTTWADDGHQYTVWGDGGGFGGTNATGRVSLGVGRVEGGPDDYKGVNVWGGHQAANKATFKGKSYGIICIGGALYMWVSPGSGATSFTEARLTRSADHGARWTRADWAFTKEDGVVMPTICQFGKDYAGARDDYVYHYMTRLDRERLEFDVQKTGQIDLARVPKGRMLDRAAYEFFAGLDPAGRPTWVKDLAARQPVFHDANGVAWSVSVCYNAGLKRFLLCTEHKQQCRGNLGIFDAPEPWGPWTTVAYYDNWGGFGNGFFWNFSPKWFSADGRDFTLIFTGTGQWDSWNTVRGRFVVAGTADTRSSPRGNP